MKTKVIAVMLTLGLGLFTAIGCEKKSDTEKKMDEITDQAEKTKDAVEKKAEETKDAVEKKAEETKEAVDEKVKDLTK